MAIVVILAVSSLMFYSGFKYHQMKSALPASKVQGTYYLEDFRKGVDRIRRDFKPNHYTEIIGESNHIVGVPDQIAGRQDSFPDGFYSRQQTFIYKNKENGLVVVMNLSANKGGKAGYEWKHSSSYVSDYFNAPEGKFSESYDTVYPNLTMASYAFEANGISIALIGFSKVNEANKNFVLDALARFVVDLVNFLKR